MAEGVPARLSRAEARKFGLVVGAAFVTLGVLLWWRGRPLAGQVVGGFGAALILAGVMIPQALPPVYRAWMGLALVISRVTTPIILGIMYFVVVTPIGLTRRLFGHDALKPRRTGTTSWVPRAQGQGRSDLKRQF